MSKSPFELAAAEAKAAFVWRKRGEERDLIAHFSDDAPEWVRDAVYAMHSGAPQDSVFALAASAAADIVNDFTDGDDESDAAHTFADSETPIYNGELAAWLAESVHNAAWIEEARDEMGRADDLFKEIAAGYYYQARDVFANMLEAVRQRAEEIEEERADVARLADELEDSANG